MSRSRPTRPGCGCLRYVCRLWAWARAGGGSAFVRLLRCDGDLDFDDAPLVPLQYLEGAAAQLQLLELAIKMENILHH